DAAKDGVAAARAARAPLPLAMQAVLKQAIDGVEAKVDKAAQSAKDQVKQVAGVSDGDAPPVSAKEAPAGDAPAGDAIAAGPIPAVTNLQQISSTALLLKKEIGDAVTKKGKMDNQNDQGAPKEP